MDPNLKIRIICDGWYDTELGRSFASGAVVSGLRISGRLLEALNTRETFRDRAGRELPVCEVVVPVQILPIISEPVPGTQNPVPIIFPEVEIPEPEEVKFIDPDSGADEPVMPIRILEARMSVTGVKVVDLGIRKGNSGVK